MIITLTPKTPTRGITYEYNGKQKTLYGGSFFEAPVGDGFEEYLTINLMKEIELPCDIHVPITDFSVPTDINQLEESFLKVLEFEGDSFVGCFGGKGRTGLFMACFLKYLGYHDVIQQVRQEYFEHAVENILQTEYVWDFNRYAQGIELSSSKVTWK